MEMKTGQIYYNKKDVLDFIRIEKEHFPVLEHAHIRHLRILSHNFAYRDKWDKEEIVLHDSINKDFKLLLGSCANKDKFIYHGEDGLTSEVTVYPWPPKLIELVNKYGKQEKIKKKGKKK